jgi:outer membrane protein insertion porin family
MRWRTAWVIEVSVLLFVCCQAGLAQSYDQTSGAHKVVVESLAIFGTRAVDSAELADITDSMSGSTFNDDADELSERIRNQFQTHGYFKAEVEKLDIKVIDPLASPKPVRMEAQVSEGARYRLSSIDFIGNHALSAQELRADFLIKTGDVFTKSKIGAGLEGMRVLLGSRGFLDFYSVPETTFDSGSTVNLNIEVQEGRQYRMDKLEITGPPEVTEKLQTRWELETGAVFDATYMKTFLEKNSSLIPADFVEQTGVELFKDCNSSTVSVHIHLTQDPQHAALDRTKHVICAASEEKKKSN